jgi:hypothetical protein
MKRLFLVVLCTMISVAAFAQAKKPTIMVVPSDQWCIANGYYDEVNLNGVVTKVVSYEKALANADLNSVIIGFGNEMVDRGFPLTDLNASIQAIKQEEALNGDDVQLSRVEMLLNQAKADIMLEVSWDIVEPSPDKFAVRYNLKGMDTYSLKQITGCDLMTQPSGYVNPASMLRQVLQDSFDEFCNRLDLYFADMGNNGRETSFTFLIKKNSMVNFADEVGSDGDTLADVIEYWFDDETVSGRYTVSAASDNRMVFSQVRIALYDEKGRAIDARRFVNNLVSKLRGEEYGVAPIKVIAIGLGSCRIEIGD